MPNDRPTYVDVPAITYLCPAHRVHFNHWLPKLFRTGAMTPIGGHIFARGSYLSEWLHAHEGGHLAQIVELGWPRFAWRYLRSIFKHHDERPLEIDADRFADRYEGDFEAVQRP